MYLVSSPMLATSRRRQTCEGAASQRGLSTDSSSSSRKAPPACHPRVCIWCGYCIFNEARLVDGFPLRLIASTKSNQPGPETIKAAFTQHRTNARAHVIEQYRIPLDGLVVLRGSTLQHSGSFPNPHGVAVIWSERWSISIRIQ